MSGKRLKAGLLVATAALVAVAIATLAPFGRADNTPVATIAVIGLDAAGQAAAREIPAAAFASTLSEAVGSVDSSFTSALASMPPGAGTSYGVHTIGVGVGVSGQIGVGPIFSLSFSPRLRLVYTDSRNPIYPD